MKLDFNKIHWASWGLAAICALSGLALRNLAPKFKEVYNELYDTQALQESTLTAIAMSPLSWIFPFLLGSMILVRDFYPGMRKWLPDWLFFILVVSFVWLVIKGLFNPLVSMPCGLGH